MSTVDKDFVDRLCRAVVSNETADILQDAQRWLDNRQLPTGWHWEEKGNLSIAVNDNDSRLQAWVLNDDFIFQVPGNPSCADDPEWILTCSIEIVETVIAYAKKTEETPYPQE